MSYAILKQQYYKTVRKKALSTLVGVKWCDIPKEWYKRPNYPNETPKRNNTFCARWCTRGPCQGVVY